MVELAITVLKLALMLLRLPGLLFRMVKTPDYHIPATTRVVVPS
jgi:hypothetical protein